jgi:hypothetical protein
LSSIYIAIYPHGVIPDICQSFAPVPIHLFPALMETPQFQLYFSCASCYSVCRCYLNHCQDFMCHNRTCRYHDRCADDRLHYNGSENLWGICFSVCSRYFWVPCRNGDCFINTRLLFREDAEESDGLVILRLPPRLTIYQVILCTEMTDHSSSSSSSTGSSVSGVARSDDGALEHRPSHTEVQRGRERWRQTAALGLNQSRNGLPVDEHARRQQAAEDRRRAAVERSRDQQWTEEERGRWEAYRNQVPRRHQARHPPGMDEARREVEEMLARNQARLGRTGSRRN